VDKAFALDTNQVSDVFKTDEGYNIVMVAARREQIERTFQQMKGTVLRKAKSAKQQELYDSYVANLKKDAKIDVNQKELDKIEIKSSRRPFAPGLMGEDGEMMDEHGEEGGGLQPGATPMGLPEGVRPPMPGAAPLPGAKPANPGAAAGGKPAENK
jgi:hypothetical protein